MKTYELIKKGNYVYVAGSKCIYKVNLKNKSKKKLSKYIPYFATMKLHKGYIYYLTGCDYEHFTSNLRRVKISSGKDSSVFKHREADTVYAIKKSKLYVNYIPASTDRLKKKVMKWQKKEGIHC